MEMEAVEMAGEGVVKGLIDRGFRWLRLECFAVEQSVRGICWSSKLAGECILTLRPRKRSIPRTSSRTGQSRVDGSGTTNQC
jgi:hypothetical protein